MPHLTLTPNGLSLRPVAPARHSIELAFQPAGPAPGARAAVCEHTPEGGHVFLRTIDATTRGVDVHEAIIAVSGLALRAFFPGGAELTVDFTPTGLALWDDEAGVEVARVTIEADGHARLESPGHAPASGLDGWPAVEAALAGLGLTLGLREAPPRPEPTEEETLALVGRLHADQFDQGGQPYIGHLSAVRDLLGPDADEPTRKGALLHDSIEDTGASAAGLRALGFSPTVVDTVVLLTRETTAAVPKSAPDADGWTARERTYLDKIRALVASGNVRAMQIKWADNTHNSDPARDVHLTPRQRAWAANRRRLYAASRTILEEGLAAAGCPVPSPGAAP